MRPLSWPAARAVCSVVTTLGLVFAFLLGYVVPLPQRLVQFDGWQVGDWLINYSGGLVRRGLSGELVFLFTSNGTEAIAAVVAVQTLLALTLFVIVGVLFWHTERGTAWMMLVLSPAFLFFPALDVTSNSRKELIVLVALGVVALSHRFWRVNLGLWTALPLFTLGVFSHEALVVTLPVFIYLAIASTGRVRIQGVLSCYVIAASGALVLALVRPGNAQTSTLICQDWNQIGIADCGNALAALGMPASEMLRELVSNLYPAYWTYLLPVALASLPFFALRFWPRERLIGVVTIVSVLPLFVLGWDYGRWIFLITAQLSIVALALPERTQPMRVPLYGALAFVLLWGFRHYGDPLTEGFAVRWLSTIFS